MKHKGLNRIISVLLCLCMVVGLVPAGCLPVFRAHAEDTHTESNVDGGLEGQETDIFSALGFDLSVLPEGYDPNTTETPFGRDKLPGNQIFEMLISNAGGTNPAGKNNNELGVSNVVGASLSGPGVPLQMFAAAAADFDNDGLPGEVVYVGVEAFSLMEGRELAVRLLPYDGKAGAFGSHSNIAAIETAEVFHSTETSVDLKDTSEQYTQTRSIYEYDFEIQNLLQVTDGDYDGDGYAEIAVYVPEAGNARIDIYKWMRDDSSKSDDWMDMGNWGVVWSHVLSNDMVPNMVSLVSADINQDGVDDLGIASSHLVRHGDYGKDMTFTCGETSSACILWGSRIRMLQERMPLDLDIKEKNDKGEETGKVYSQVRTSLTVGDINADGYDELVVTGQPADDLGKNTTRSVIIYAYDGTDKLASLYNGMVKPVDGEYKTEEITNPDNTTTTKTYWQSNNNFDEIYHSSEGMRTNAAVMRLQGFDNPYLYLDSCLYEYSGALSLKMSLDDSKYDGTNKLGSVWLSASDYVEFGAVAADINGKDYDQLYVSFYTESSGGKVSWDVEWHYVAAIESWLDTSKPTVTTDHAHHGGISGLSGNAGGTLVVASHTDKQEGTEKGDFSQQTEGKIELPCCYVATPVDVDRDTTIIEYTGEHYLMYSDPKVLAVLAAPPFFKDVEAVYNYDYAWQNSTAWSINTGSGSTEGGTSDISIGGFINPVEKISSIVIMQDIAIQYTRSWGESVSEAYEYSMTFQTTTDEDAVVLCSIPTEVYVYRVYTPDENGNYGEPQPLLESRNFRAVTQVLPLDEYEAVRLNYSGDESSEPILPKVKGEILKSTPGVPGSYPNSSAGFEVISQFPTDSEDHNFQDPAGTGFGAGVISQEITFSTETEEFVSNGFAIDYRLGGGYDGEIALGIVDGLAVTGGIAGSGGYSANTATVNMSGTTISGTIFNMPEQFRDYGYYFDWQIFSYQYTDGTSSFPVITYLVNNVSQPPLLPDDFQQDVERTTSDKNVLTWSYDGDYSKFIIYKYFDFPVGGGLQKVAEYGAGEAPFRMQYDENGKPYKEFYFEDTNLAPYSEYQYAIQVERLSEIPPLSSPSALVTARTKAAVGNPDITILESDGANDGTMHVFPDRNWYLTAEVTGPDGENGYDYYSVIQYQWQKQDDNGKWVDMVNKTDQTLVLVSPGKEANGEYRCRINVATKADNTYISAYSDVVEVKQSKRSSVMEQVYVREVKGGIEFYVKITNAHSDSGKIPTGTVIFNIYDVKTGAHRQHKGTLNGEGIYNKIVDFTAPAGTYDVEVIYEDTTGVFKPCFGECVFLAGQDLGYTIDAPNSVTYGDGAKIVFNQVTKENGFAIKTPVSATQFGLSDTPPDGAWVHLSANNMGPANEMTDMVVTYLKQGDKVEAGKNYYYKAAWPGDTVFFVYSFVSSYDGFVEELGRIRPNEVVIRPVHHCEFDQQYFTWSDADNCYYLKENTPAGQYTICMEAPDGSICHEVITVNPRDITLQLPTTVKKQDSNVAMGDITYGELEVVSGSWAPCDTDENGKVTGTVASTSVIPSYTNTAGTHFYKDSKLDTCGSYTIDASDMLDNYNVTYRRGSLFVIGGNRDVTFGPRPFEGKDVGMLYMVSPDYAYTRVANGLTKSEAVGSQVVFTAAPDDGYQVYDWYVNGVAQGVTDTRFVYEMQNQDVIVEVQFVFRPDTLTFGVAGATEGGTLVCSDGTLTSGSVVIPNTCLTYTAVAKPGYHFKEWRYTELGNGTAYYNEDDGKMESSFLLVMPKISCSLYAVFERDEYTLTYTDKNGNDGLTAWYMAKPFGDATAQEEKVTVQSGDAIPGDTEVTIQPKEGFSLHPDYNFVSFGSQGKADYTAETYTLIITEDTQVIGYTNQDMHTLTVKFEVNTTFAFCEGAKVTLYLNDDVANKMECTYSKEQKTCTISDIPGGSKITAKVEYPGYYVYDGLDVNGTLCTDTKYTLSALGEDTTLTLKLTEKPVYQVTLADIGGKGTYEVTLPAGAAQEDDVVTCHENDPLTIQVKPATGYTVTYWHVKETNGEGEWETKASSLRYQFPSLTADYTFTPVFSTTTYHKISWPSLAYYGLTLTPENGSLALTPTGSEFSFTLPTSGGDSYSAVLANGLEFKPKDRVGADYPNVVEDINGKHIFTIRNIRRDQVISVSREVVDNTLSVTPDKADVHPGQTVTVTVWYSGVKPTHFQWDNTSVIDNGDGTYTIPVPKEAKVSDILYFKVYSYYDSVELATTQVKITITGDDVASIAITTDDITASTDGSYWLKDSNSNGPFDFDATVSFGDGTKTTDNVTWSLWGAQMRGTTVDENGVLTISPNEHGVKCQMKLIATYHYPDGSTVSSEVVIHLRHAYNDNGFCVSCGAYQPATDVDNDGVYEIANAGQLFWFAAVVNGGYEGTPQNAAASAILTADIDLENRAWTPIGRSVVVSSSYRGYFDGRGHVISGLFIDTWDVAGLFGYVGTSGVIQGVGIAAGTVQGSAQFTGGIAGVNNGVIRNSFNGASVSNRAEHGYSAGVAGQNQGTITQCYNTGTVTGGNWTGGITGFNYMGSVLSDCYNTGNVIGGGYWTGGIAGINYATIANCHNVGNITGEHTVVGIAHNTSDVTVDCTAKNCYYLADTEDGLGGKTAAQFASGEVTWLLNDNRETIVWKQTLGQMAYPTFVGDVVYQIHNCAGDVLYSNTDGDLDHVYGDDNICDVCGHDKTPPAVEQLYPSMSLKDEVCYNFYFAVHRFEADVENMGLLVWSSEITDGTIENAERVFAGATYNRKNGMYKVQTDGIPAKEMGDMIYYKIYAKQADGTYVYSDLYHFNAVLYAEAVFKQYDDPLLHAAVVALLNYGAAAQIQFGYRTDSLMNAGLTAQQQAMVMPYGDVASKIDGVDAVDFTKVGAFAKTETGFSGHYPTVSLKGAFAINYYFIPDQGEVGEVTFYYWSETDYRNADILTAENATGMMTMTKSGNLYRATITGIRAIEIGQTYYVCGVYQSGGKMYSSGVMSYSLAAYCMEQSEHATGSLQTLAQLTAVYGYYAKTYFKTTFG